MSRQRAANENKVRLAGFFLFIVLITVLCMYVISALLNPVGDQGLIIVLCITISLQLSFLTTLQIVRKK